MCFDFNEGCVTNTRLDWELEAPKTWWDWWSIYDWDFKQSRYVCACSSTSWEDRSLSCAVGDQASLPSGRRTEKKKTERDRSTKVSKIQDYPKRYVYNKMQVRQLLTEYSNLLWIFNTTSCTESISILEKGVDRTWKILLLNICFL